MEKKENYIILKIISVILILYFLNLYYDYYQIKKSNETFKEIGRKFKENNQQFSPNYQTQTKEKNSSNNDYLRGMDWDKLSEQNKETSRRTQEQLNQINKNSKLNQNKENPKKTLTCIKNKVGGIETVNCY
jgi:biopolymer transport protein ExbB/TolQ